MLGHDYVSDQPEAIPEAHGYIPALRFAIGRATRRLAHLNRLRKKSHCKPQRPSAAKAGVDFAILTARLKPRPFKTKSKSAASKQSQNQEKWAAG
jgi:hypothetical protein